MTTKTTSAAFLGCFAIACAGATGDAPSPAGSDTVTATTETIDGTVAPNVDVATVDTPPPDGVTPDLAQPDAMLPDAKCGDDGCGGGCGDCASGKKCDVAGQCVEGTTPGMVLVPAGTFAMGCNAAADSQCSGDEKPQHDVTLDAFEIDQTEITVEAYGQCVTAGACTAAGTWSSYCNWGVTGKSQHPVNCVTWYQSSDYCTWAGKRLCTEAEWEKAARGTDGRKYPWGNAAATCEYAVMDESGNGCGLDSTWAVGSKPKGASPYGALDMSGNVYEWVSDWYSSSYYGSSPATNPVGPSNGSFRVSRGDGFRSFGYGLRASDRDVGGPGGADDYLGARCCRSVP